MVYSYQWRFSSEVTMKELKTNIYSAGDDETRMCSYV